MITSTTSDDGFPVRCEVCGADSLDNLSSPPGDSVCPSCGSFLWVTAIRDIASARNLFRPDLTIPNLDVQSRDHAIEALCQTVANSLDWSDEQCGEFFQRILKREDLGSTGIGRGWAVPHAKVEWIDKPYVVMALVPKGIDFNALDGERVSSVIMIASSTHHPGDHLRLLESISRCLRFVRANVV